MPSPISPFEIAGFIVACLGILGFAVKHGETLKDLELLRRDVDGKVSKEAHAAHEKRLEALEDRP